MELKLENWQKEYLVLDFDHLFLADTLAEELILLGLEKDRQILSATVTDFQEFKPDFEDQQSLQQLSGGEKSLLAVLLYLRIAVSSGKSLRFLLYNVIESLSLHNREALLRFIKQIDTRNQLSFWQLKDEKVEQFH